MNRQGAKAVKKSKHGMNRQGAKAAKKIKNGMNRQDAERTKINNGNKVQESTSVLIQFLSLFLLAPWRFDDLVLVFLGG